MKLIKNIGYNKNIRIIYYLYLKLFSSNLLISIMTIFDVVIFYNIAMKLSIFYQIIDLQTYFFSY